MLVKPEICLVTVDAKGQEEDTTMFVFLDAIEVPEALLRPGLGLWFTDADPGPKGHKARLLIEEVNWTPEDQTAQVFCADLVCQSGTATPDEWAGVLRRIGMVEWTPEPDTLAEAV